jgi:hypothetical protein
LGNLFSFKQGFLEQNTFEGAFFLNTIPFSFCKIGKQLEIVYLFENKIAFEIGFGLLETKNPFA